MAEHPPGSGSCLQPSCTSVIHQNPSESTRIHLLSFPRGCCLLHSLCSEFHSRAGRGLAVLDVVASMQTFVSPGRSAALQGGVGQKSLLWRVCLVLTELSGSLSGTCFQTSPKGHRGWAGSGLVAGHSSVALSHKHPQQLQPLLQASPAVHAQLEGQQGGHLLPNLCSIYRACAENLH